MEYFLTRKTQYRGIKLREVLAKIYTLKIGKPFLSSRVTLPSSLLKRYFIFQLELFTPHEKKFLAFNKSLILFSRLHSQICHRLFVIVHFSHFLKIYLLYLQIVNIKRRIRYFQEKFSKFFQSDLQLFN